MTDLVVGEDGLSRCTWAVGTPELQEYHDAEWGRPVGEDVRVYEKLCLEGFQAGLSWLTILRKRDNFRRAFSSFDPATVAKFDAADVERLLTDSGIVRNRAKIAATITNARATIALREEGISLAGFVWQHRPTHEAAPKRMGDLPASTPESKTLSAQLRKRGFAFVGPTTVYAAMQSLGVVNDHLVGCAWQRIVDEQLSNFSIPPLEGH